MLKRKLFSCLAYVVFAASLFATACSGRKTQQESVELKKIVIAEPLHSIGYLPLYIGQQEGFFAEEGLDVEVIQATGGSHVTSVMSGDAWGVIGGVDSNAIPNASGNCPDPVIAVCNCVNRANVYLCAAVGEEYTGNTDEELAQYFKGKKINSGRFGGSPNLCVRYLLLSIGLDPDKDVVMVEPADMSTSVAVVQSGQADISWAAEPQIVDGMKSGVWTDAFYQFTDLGDYAYSVLSVSQSTIRNDPETVQHFVNAMLKSLSAAQYALGKVYLIGKNVQQDKELAYDYFLKSAEQGNIYAAYFLEHWNDMPHPDLFLMATRLMRHLEHIIEENVAGRKSGGRRQGIDRKLARKIRQKKIAQGHAVDDHEDMVQTQ